MESIIYEVKNNVHWVILNNPPSNALGLTSLTYLQSVLDEVERDANAKCLVIASCTCDFCAGADIKQVIKDSAPAQFSNRWLRSANKVLSKLESLTKPTIAAINGSANGFGFDLALACDYRYAESHAQFNPRDNAVDYCSDNVSKWNNPSIENPASPTRNKENWSAEEALIIGMVSEVLESSFLLDRVESIAVGMAV